jgi:hypothetical protein
MDCFYKKSTRAENDSANKQREDILCTILDTTYSDTEEDRQGLHVQTEFKQALHKIAELSNILVSSITVSKKAGRTNNYDFDVVYNGIHTRKVEFKYGCSSIKKLPQFLSLSVKQFLPEFIPFWWSHLDKYTSCDEGITHPKPSLEEYTKMVSGVNYSASPFFQQLKDREDVHKKEKCKVVDDSISEFLSHLPPFSLEDITQRCLAQQDKYFLLWDKRMFVETFKPEYCSNIRFHSVTKNCIKLVSDGATFSLLLRWRNHKGILNPAWQISMSV